LSLHGALPIFRLAPRRTCSWTWPRDSRSSTPWRLAKAKGSERSGGSAGAASAAWVSVDMCGPAPETEDPSLCRLYCCSAARSRRQLNGFRGSLQCRFRSSDNRATTARRVHPDRMSEGQKRNPGGCRGFLLAALAYLSSLRWCLKNTPLSPKDEAMNGEVSSISPIFTALLRRCWA